MTDKKINPPAKNPCGSCPYRRDVPSGVWAEDEYVKLPPYDEPTFAQPLGVFMCHQQDGRMCAGWPGCHDMLHSLAIRMAALNEGLTDGDLDTVLDYQTSVPLFASGQEAHDHGMAELEAPGQRAGKVIDKLTRKRGGAEC